MKLISSKRVADSRFDNRQSKSGPADENPKWVGLLAVALTFAFGGAVVEAQQPTKVPRIGVLLATSLASARMDAFRQGLRELGYVEGKNIIIDWRASEGRYDLLPALAAELVRHKVDVIVTGGAPAARVAKDMTVTIPIVMTQVGDPVGSGFVASLAQPGGNITGLSSLAPELSGKQLDLLKEIVANLSRVAVLRSSTDPDDAQTLKEVELAARALKVQRQIVDVLSSSDMAPAFGAATKGRADAVLMLVTGPIINPVRSQVIALAVKNRLPVMYRTQGIVDAGGLMTYGVNNTDLARRAATFVDKILKGRKPADLPVEQPIKFEFIVNLKAAKQIGLTIPPNVLARADRVIK